MYELESRIKSIRQREMDKLSPSVKVTTLGEGGEYRAFIPLVSTPPLSWDFAIDLSRWNIPICWRGIESHIQDGKKISRAIVKASEGTMTSYYVTEYWDWVDRANIPVTAYAFWRRYGGTAKAQADWFLKRAIKSPVSPWLDIEDTNVPMTPAYNATYLVQFDEWCDRVEQAWGMPATIYTGAWYWNTRFYNKPHLLSTRPLAVAHYKPYADFSPLLPYGWTDWAYWQYTSQATITGCQTNIDLNIRKQ
jgi:lysozyme